MKQLKNSKMAEKVWNNETCKSSRNSLFRSEFSLSFSLECITLFRLPFFANKPTVTQEILLFPISTYRICNFNLWQVWKPSTGTGWWVATHIIHTSFNLLLVFYCGCLPLQTDYLAKQTKSQIHPINNTNSWTATIFCKNILVLFWNTFGVVLLVNVNVSSTNDKNITKTKLKV